MIRAIVACAACAMLVVAAPAAGGPPVSGRDWTHATGDAGNTHYSSLHQINVANVPRLAGAWTSGPFDDGANSRATPVVRDGVVFVTAGAKIYALDGSSGKRLWTYQYLGSPLSVNGMFGGDSRPQGRGTPNVQGPAVGAGLLFVGLTDGHLIAVDQKTGKLVWDHEVGVEAGPNRGGVSASPVYSNGVVYTSLTFDEARYIGRAVALDAKTGRQLWRWNSVPAPGEPGSETWGLKQSVVDGLLWTMGGASVWLPPVVDEKLGTVYLVTGNPSPNRAGALRPGDNLYSSSLVALDAKSGTLRWHYQFVHHDMWEMDITVPPVAMDVTIAGRQRPGLAVMRPDNSVFFIDRETGKPLYPVEERPVPQNAAHASALTQPFPAGKGDPVHRPCSAWTGVVPGVEVICNPFVPPYEDRVFLMWGPNSRSSQMAYSPANGLIYLQGSDKLVLQWASDHPFNWEFLESYMGQRLPTIADAAARTFFVALDPKSYDVVWKAEFPLATGYGVGGFLTTAGGLAFHRLSDGNLAAFDAASGSILWKFQTGTLATAPAYPISYEAGGQQYIAVVQGRELLAFRLGGTMAARAAPAPAGPQPLFARGQLEDTTLIRAQGANDYGYRYEISPTRARVKAGQVVTFVNNSAEIRDFSAADGSWSTGPMLPRQAKALTFDRPGSFLYRSIRQPWAMAELVVQEPGAPAGGSTGTTAVTGAFAAQVERGKRQYGDSCSVCHGAELNGRDPIPPLLGPNFTGNYVNAKALIDRTATTMPTGQAGTLPHDAYVDIVAYLLQANSRRPGDGAALTDVSAAAMRLTN